MSMASLVKKSIKYSAKKMKNLIFIILPWISASGFVINGTEVFSGVMNTPMCDAVRILVTNFTTNNSPSLPEQENGLRIATGLPGTNFQPICNQNVADICVNITYCDQITPYRTINGSCNNLLFPMWGLTGTALVRLIPANYQDGLHEPRLAKSGNPLPGARELSVLLLPRMDVPDHINTLAVMQWGQLISHETTHIATIPVINLGPIQCCINGSMPDLVDLPAACNPISIKPDDPFFSQFNQTCLNFVRAPTTTDYGCSLSPQQQLAQVTHFVDASFIYGSTDHIAKSIRAFSGGLLSVREYNGEYYMPQQENATEYCHVSNDAGICYLAGDNRVNQNTGISLLHTLFIRQHNNLCVKLQEINPQWSDERLYQEARRIVIASVQRITYTDFLTALLGVVLQRFKLSYKDLKFLSTAFVRYHRFLDYDFIELYNGYEQLLNPTSVNEFTSAAYRALHNLIPTDMKLVNENRCLGGSLLLSDWFFRPEVIQNTETFDNLIRGLATQRMNRFGPEVSNQIADKLFIAESPHGGDLFAVDIQRGRDQGLAPYNEFRAACGLPKASNFSDFNDTIDNQYVQMLSNIYEDVNDVDFYVGGIMERNVPGALTGPTFQCIIGEQFLRWRSGDRFYYQFVNQTGSFTPEQYNQLQKISLGLIFCQYGNDVRYMQENVFYRPGTRNSIIPCSEFPTFNFLPWLDRT